MICHEHQLVPICGHSFWENQNGARIFCKMLGKSGGKVENKKEILQEDAYIVGKCGNQDTDLTGCNGGCNEHTVGGSCSRWIVSCNKGSTGLPRISCSGKKNVDNFETLKRILDKITVISFTVFYKNTF